MNVFGIQIDAPHIRTCLLRKGSKGIVIETLNSASLNEDLNVKRLYIENFKGRIVSGLSAKNFLIRSMEVKVTGGKHVDEAIAFQSEALSHFKPEDVLTVPVIDKREKGKAEVLLFTVPRERMKEHLLELERLKIDPDAVSTVPSALCRFIRWKFPKLADAFIIDLGSNEITCALLENGDLKKSHAISKGIEGLLVALHEDRKKILLKKEIEGAAKQIDLLLLKPGLNPHLSGELNELRQELAKIYFSFCRSLTKPVIFTGRSDAFIHLREYLIDYTEGEWPISFDEQKFAVSIGLALDQISEHPIQLRREEFFPRKNWARMGFYSLLLLASSFILSGSLLILGMESVSSRKQEMLNYLQPTSRKSPLKKRKIEKQIDQWISAIEANNKEYAYILQGPKVAEVLAWLTSHPLLEQFKNGGDPIDVREIKYQLISYPTVQSGKDPFLVKVEMEFKFKSLMNARKFHESLRQGDEWVDPDLEMTWDALNDGYCASFYMKNRSPHVP